MSLSYVADLSMSLATSLLSPEYPADVWCHPAPDLTGSSKPDLFDPVVRTGPGWCSGSLRAAFVIMRQGLTTGRHPHAGPGEHVDFGLDVLTGAVGPIDEGGGGRAHQTPHQESSKSRHNIGDDAEINEICLNDPR